MKIQIMSFPFVITASYVIWLGLLPYMLDACLQQAVAMCVIWHTFPHIQIFGD